MAKCRSCGANILWIKMESGKMMPVNEYGKHVIHIGDKDLGRVLYAYESHFSTCPNADKHRQKKKG